VTDSFVPALEELSQALTAGEDPEQALAEIAEDHSLAAHALRNRAVRAFGPLETYKERQAALKLDLNTGFGKFVVGQQLTPTDPVVSITRDGSRGAVRLRWGRGRWAAARCEPP